MSGFVRAKTPDPRPNMENGQFSRDDIVSQLAAQGLGEREAGWITIECVVKSLKILEHATFLYAII